MAENDSAPEKKKSDKKLFLILLLLAVLISVTFFMFPPKPVDVADNLGDQVAETEVVDAEENFEELCQDEGYRLNDEGQVREECADYVVAEEEAAVSSDDAAAGFDMALAQTERILGDRSAPIKISEHSSFSCGHCGKFHQNTLPAFKAQYIDTGKAYIVFSDFPLNAPALHASMAGRCLPNPDHYFNYVEDVFADQQKWAYDATKYMPYLKAKAAEYGLGEEEFNACIQNEELQEALLKRIRAVQERYEIRSTPSFVVNNQKVVTGAMDSEQFAKAIEDAVAAIEAEANSPSE